MSLGYLYIVSTSIGNLEEVTLRALGVLKEADFTAEDSRHSSKLLNHYGIRKPLISYWSQKEKARSASGLSNRGVYIYRLSAAKGCTETEKIKENNEDVRGDIARNYI